MHISVNNIGERIVTSVADIKELVKELDVISHEKGEILTLLDDVEMYGNVLSTATDDKGKPC